MKGLNGQVGSYTHFGILSGLTDIVQQHKPVPCNCRLDLQLNFYGLPSFNSLSMEFWPILWIRLVKCIHCIPFVFGLYCGSKKPSSVSEYLQEFDYELCSLLVYGITYDSIHWCYSGRELCMWCSSTIICKNCKIRHRLQWPWQM